MLPILFLLLCGALSAQVRSTSELGAANLPAQKIGPNDLIAISVYDAPELTRTVRVGADGFIRLPMLKRRVRADGLLPAELEATVAEALHAEQLLVEPVVTVTIAEYHSRPISVAGAVRNPVTFQAAGPMTLLDALTRAGGLSVDAGPEILVSRTQPGEDGKPATLVQRIPVRGLIDAADPELNLKLAGGEEIRVPEVGKIFVVGSVKKPGVYPVQGESETTVLQMLALAEGLVPFAAKRAYIYRREAATGSKHEIAIELKQIMERKAPDIPLDANDILYIPDNSGRRVAVHTLEKIAGFGTATASGILIWRR
ncbi:MAG TPA: polysaccharide biosynthesis/export family protein [Bryobacteraceae bacterium]|nr:polysaccharide biosynthesis/export family protein [Bryobacteraceae bacterium]